MIRASAIILCIGGLAWAAAAGGCSAAWRQDRAIVGADSRRDAAATGPSRGHTAELMVAPAEYAAAFAAAREVLVAARFELERVDAAAGLIETRPKRTSGLATPWDDEQSTIGQEVEDLLNRHHRRVRMWFVPLAEAEMRGAGDPPAPPRPQAAPGPAPADRRLEAGPMVLRVEVVVLRVRRPGWRLEPTAMRFSSRAVDPALHGREMLPQYAVPFMRDQRLERRLVDKIRSRLADKE